MDAQHIDTLRQAAYAIADAHQALHQLRTQINNPDLNRLCSDLEYMAGGSLGRMTQTF